jgi:hypothetical protein
VNYETGELEFAEVDGRLAHLTLDQVIARAGGGGGGGGVPLDTTSSLLSSSSSSGSSSVEASSGISHSTGT